MNKRIFGVVLINFKQVLRSDLVVTPESLLTN